MKRLLVILMLTVAAGACRSQRPMVLTPVRIDTSGIMTVGGRLAPSATFEARRDDPFFTTNHVDWPGPNRYRSASGAPGPEYWQQRADYTIAATLDTGAQRLSGTVTIRYTNNSPDTLRFVWLQLDQNLYRPGSKGSALFAADSRWGVRGFQGGYDLTNVKVNGEPVAPKVDDTMMRLDLTQPIPSGGGKATITMDFSFRVPEHGSDRMGRDGTLYEIAQWYPRMAVYDDVRGWNTDPYLGQGEFYLEYGDIDYAVTAPAGYTIAGTGTLINPIDVLSASQRERLARGARSQDVVRVITEAEARAAPRAGTKTWRFRAGNVRDVAWAGAPDFRWDATSWNGILCQAYYQLAKSGRSWESAAEQTQWTIRQYSQDFFPYPYPQATSVAGPVGGMEYPMFVMVHYGNPLDDPTSIFGTINHEHGHEWFPMIVGSNERRYAWQDEGFNTYINTSANERRAPGTDVWSGYLTNWKTAVDERTQAPLMTSPDHIVASALGPMGYRKPATVMLALRNHVVGRETFDLAMREYIRRWAFKHPTPGDFFRTVENVSGADLSWYWRGFFYSTDVLDIGIDSVSMRTSEGEQLVTVSLHRVTSIPFPVELRLSYADGSTQDVRLPVDIWASCQDEHAGGCDHFDATLPARGAVTGVRLWPDPTVPDWNPANDAWGRPPAANPASAVTEGGLMSAIPKAQP